MYKNADQMKQVRVLCSSKTILHEDTGTNKLIVRES
jgi:hypothetical protein